jgi:hypothetical protein
MAGHFGKANFLGQVAPRIIFFANLTVRLFNSRCTDSRAAGTVELRGWVLPSFSVLEGVCWMCRSDHPLLIR